jgi:hypothetical protein
LKKNILCVNCTWPKVFHKVLKISLCYEFAWFSVRQTLKKLKTVWWCLFCVDFRYLNSNAQAFLYTILNVDELTGSFTRHIPNYISSIDFRSGFFQMRISYAIRPSCEVAVYMVFGVQKLHQASHVSGVLPD